ncbi:MAG: hypothetical protein K0B15_12340 [Lentimicrobium sp.]|nr:hypothetical protein [Lentimicrobium sp.]
MKRILLALLISLISVSVSAQNLTMDEMLKIMKMKDVGTVDDYMKSKKWNLIIIEKPKSDEAGVLAYSYEYQPLTTSLSIFMKKICMLLT